MQRELLFRAWDNERKQFVPQGEIVFSDYGDTNISVIPNDQSYIGDSCHNGEPQRGRFEITQYTGLKDKNNKDIYDLDHLKDDNDNIGKVIWGDHGWLVEFETETMDLTETEHWAIVTGNVFENQ